MPADYTHTIVCPLQSATGEVGNETNTYTAPKTGWLVFAGRAQGNVNAYINTIPSANFKTAWYEVKTTISEHWLSVVIPLAKGQVGGTYSYKLRGTTMSMWFLPAIGDL